ncbi:hypothetical protein D3C76_1466220 [compost metagenome]
MGGNLQATINATHRQYANRAAGAVDKFQAVRQQLVKTKLEDRVGVATADFHHL